MVTGLQAASNARVQLSLYVPAPVADTLEAVRRVLDPVQAALIPAHVTLCREDELQHITVQALHTRLSSVGAGGVTLTFDSPQLFQGHGVLLPCIDGAEEFHELRCHVLGSATVRRHAPHITLAHPRNPKDPRNVPARLDDVPAGLVIHFPSVLHIRQESASPWQILGEVLLSDASCGDAR